MLSELLDKLGKKDELIVLLGRQLDAAKDRGDGPAAARLALRVGGLLEGSLG